MKVKQTFDWGWPKGNSGRILLKNSLFQPGRLGPFTGRAFFSSRRPGNWRRREEFCELSEVLGGGCEVEFVVRAEWAT